MAKGCQHRKHSSVTINAYKTLDPTRHAKENALFCAQLAEAQTPCRTAVIGPQNNLRKEIDSRENR